MTEAIAELKEVDLENLCKRASDLPRNLRQFLLNFIADLKDIKICEAADGSRINMARVSHANVVKIAKCVLNLERIDYINQEDHLFDWGKQPHLKTLLPDSLN